LTAIKPINQTLIKTLVINQLNAQNIVL